MAGEGGAERQPHEHWYDAATEPRPDGRGGAAIRGDGGWCIVTPQRSPGLMAGEGWGWALVVGGDRVAATEPRPDGRGGPTDVPMAAHPPQRRNGAPA